MRSFDQWLLEGSPDDIMIPNEDLAIRRNRANMPKLSDLAQFQTDLRTSGVGYDVRMVDPMKLKPGQRNFDMDKVREFQQTTNPTLDMPLIMSRDNYVVDGHHRWIAAANNNVPIMAHHVDMDFQDLIELLNTLQYPQNRHVE
jgi:hypothetical protein